MLQRRLALLEIVVALAILSASLIYFEGQRRLDAIVTEAERRGEFLFSSLGYQLSDALYMDDVEQIRKGGEFLRSQNVVKRISVFSGSGQYLYDSDQPLVPVGSIDSETLTRAARTPGPLHRNLGTGLAFVGAIRFDDQMLGGVYFELDLTDELAVRQTWLIQATVVLLLVLMLSAGLGYVILRSRLTSQSLEMITSKFQQLIEQSPLPYATYTPDGFLTYFNPAQAALMSGREHTRKCIEPDYNILADEVLNFQGVSRLFEQGFSGEPIETPPFAYRPSTEIESAGTLWIKARVFSSAGNESEAPEIVVIYEDVTAEKLAEDERAKLSANMLQRQKLEGLGVMARGIAHDFNNFLTPVLGHADLLTTSLKNQPTLLRSAEQIVSAAYKAADLCTQLLTHAGSAVQIRELTNVSTEVSEMNHLMHSSLSKKITLHIDVDDHVPGIMIDRSQLRQIILNLIVNAAEAIGESSGEISISTGTCEVSERDARGMLPNPHIRTGSYVYLKVEDTGSGMDEKTKESLFNPFFTTKFTGRGLGLSTVLGIVGDHDGGITVESALGEGATITILLPAEAEEAEDKETAEEMPTPVQKRNVLFVEDEDAVLEVGQRILESLGYSVIPARDGRQAMSIFNTSESDIDCVVLDYMMPEQDGRETYLQLRQLRPDVPVVLATGLAESQDLSGFAADPRFRMIGKPYTKGKLGSAIEEACGDTQ